MEEYENIYDKIRELFGAIPGQFSVLEEQIDIDLQMKYFEFSKEMKADLKPDRVMDESEKLFNDKVGADDKKELLAKLASVERVEAFRTIERFLHNPPEDLKEWGILAFQESKMLLESKILDENQVFISTGLGGKGDKLRYFVVLIGNKADQFTDSQKMIIRNEFEVILKKYNSEIENFEFSGSLATVKAVIPMNVTIRSIFEEAIGECNEFGNFLIPNFIITNVKELSFDEIRDFLKKQRSEQQDIDDEDIY